MFQNRENKIDQNFDFELGPMIPPNQALPQMEEPAPVAPQGYG